MYVTRERANDDKNVLIETKVWRISQNCRVVVFSWQLNRLLKKSVQLRER